MPDPLSNYAQAVPDRIMLTDGDTVLSASETNELVNRMGNVLHCWGLRAGDALALMAGNSVHYLAMVAAATLRGLATVPINTHLSVREVAAVVAAADLRIVIVDKVCEATLVSALAETSAKIRVISLENLVADYLPSSSATEFMTGKIASTIYITSGTTGAPKATRMADVPHDVPVSDAVLDARARGYDLDQVQLTVGPLYHAGPLGEATRALLGGSTVVIMQRFDAETMLSLIEKHRVTITKIVPTHCVRLLALPESIRRRYDVSSLRRAVHTAAMMPASVKRAMIDWWGPILEEGYGSSEVGFVTRITSEEWLTHPGSVGRALPGFSLEIYDGDRRLPNGEIGQIFITSETDLDLEYLGDPDRTRAAHRAPKQFTLGDLGHLDDEGYLYLADRRLDLIITGGVNVYPAEVEAELAGIEFIVDAGVFGLDHAEWGHEVCAAVMVAPEVAPSTAVAEQLRERLSRRLASYKVPRRIFFVDELPRYDTGKLRRRELRERDWSGVVAL